MRYSLDRYRMRIEIDTKECDIPADLRTRMQEEIGRLGQAVHTFPESELDLLIIHHPRSDRFHAEAKLKLPGKTLFTGEWDAYADLAINRCLAKLRRKVEDYRAHPDREALRQAAQRAELDRKFVAPTDPDVGRLGQAVDAGDYSTFRETLAPFEEWLRDRVGRWVQRYPEADERVGEVIPIADVVEEVYLMAFERYHERPDEIPFHQWLDELIDPSLRAIYHNWDEERENVSLARTLRETLPGG